MTRERASKREREREREREKSFDRSIVGERERERERDNNDDHKTVHKGGNKVPFIGLLASTVFVTFCNCSDTDASYSLGGTCADWLLSKQEEEEESF